MDELALVPNVTAAMPPLVVLDPDVPDPEPDGAVTKNPALLAPPRFSSNT